MELFKILKSYNEMGIMQFKKKTKLKKWKKIMIKSLIITLETYLIENNIKMIRDAPYSSHYQGIVERIHVTIRKALLCNF